MCIIFIYDLLSSSAYVASQNCNDIKLRSFHFTWTIRNYLLLNPIHTTHRLNNCRWLRFFLINIPAAEPYQHCPLITCATSLIENRIEIFYWPNISLPKERHLPLKIRFIDLIASQQTLSYHSDTLWYYFRHHYGRCEIARAKIHASLSGNRKGDIMSPLLRRARLLVRLLSFVVSY